MVGSEVNGEMSGSTEGLGPAELVEVAGGCLAYIQPDGTWFINNAGKSKSQPAREPRLEANSEASFSEFTLNI